LGIEAFAAYALFMKMSEIKYGFFMPPFMPGLSLAAAVSPEFRIGPLFSVYFTALFPISILYAAMGIL